MRKSAYIFLSTIPLSFMLLFTACSEQYHIAGNSSIANLDGQTLYLKVANDDNSSDCLDSCQVIHGRFNFMGDVDSITMAIMYKGEERIMPIVLETGDLTIELGHCGSKVTGSPHNERLNTFFQKRDRIENEQWELEQECVRMMRKGKDYQEIQEHYEKKAMKLEAKMETLVTDFIKENYDNALGPGCFLWFFGTYPIPVMTDQVRNILSSAPPRFLQNPYVRNYVRRARGTVEASEGKHRRSQREKKK